MKAVVMRDKQLHLESIDAPLPARGEVLVKTLACGICGSDLHMLHHCEQVLANFKRGNIPVAFDPQQGVVFGHEYCGEIIDHGPGSDRTLKVGTRVCSLPFVITPRSFHHIGYSNHYPGGYGEQMVLPEQMLVAVPGDLPADIAALTEPLTVAAHAVNRARLDGSEAPVVIGCGPIGLALIATLKSRGIGPVVAADFSPARRALAEKFGADLVVDPAAQSPYESWLQMAAPEGYDINGPLALFGLGPQSRPCVVFECVGVPGLIQQVIQNAPPRSRLIVVGVCMETDKIEPLIAIGKEMNVHFSFGYTAEEFVQTLYALVDGRLDGAPMITGRVAQEAVGEAFASLGASDRHAKIVITYD